MTTQQQPEAQPATQQQTANNNNNNQQQPPVPGKRIIVKNLPPGISKEELRELGDRYGRVISVELVPKPARGNPFGFVSYLSEEDAEFAIYRLSGLLYKNSQLAASFSNAKPQPKPKPGAPNPNNNKQKDATKNAKPKKPMYSLRTLTPLNPATQPQGGFSNPQQTKAWDNAPGPAVPAPANYNQPVDNGFAQSGDKAGKGNAGKGGRRNNGGGPSNRSRGKSYKQAAPNEVLEEEDVPLESAPPQDSNVSVTEVQISILPNQNYYTLKLAPEQFDSFLKAVEPFLQFNEFH
jgi:RNA recognition motif-containing protein